jgi:hypothetical protein
MIKVGGAREGEIMEKKIIILLLLLLLLFKKKKEWPLCLLV